MNAGQEAKLDKLVDAVTMLVERMDNPVRTLVLEDGAPPPRLTRDTDPVGTLDEEAVITRVIARLKTEAPKLLKVLLTRPEIEVVVERETIQVDGKTLRGRLARMIVDGWFDKYVSGTATQKELQEKGHATATPNVYRELDALCEMGFLRKQERVGFQVVPDMKVNVLRK